MCRSLAQAARRFGTSYGSASVGCRSLSSVDRRAEAAERPALACRSVRRLRVRDDDDATRYDEFEGRASRCQHDTRQYDRGTGASGAAVPIWVRCFTEVFL